MRVVRAALLAMVVLLLIPGGTGAEGEVVVSIVDIDDASFPRMQAVVTADIDGRPIDNVDAGALRVFEGPTGAAVEARVIAVTPAVDAGTPLALVLAIDASGSMAGAPLIEARAAAASMIESLAPGDSAAVVAFADEVRVLQDVTEDRAALRDALGRLDALGNTTLHDAVAEAASRAAASGYSRRAVVLLSDGEDFGGRSSRTSEEALDAVADARTVFYVVGYGAAIDRPFLEAVAERSGGRFFLASGTEDIASVYSSLEGLLRSQLIVTFETAAPNSGAERTLEVRVGVEGGTGTATRAYASSRPAAPSRTPTPAVEATSAPTPVVAAPIAREGASPLPLVLVALGVLLPAGASVVVVARRRRARRRTVVPQLTALDARPLPADVAPRPAVAAAFIDVVEGPSAVGSIALGAAPITVGFAPECALRLRADPGVAAEHARIWTRDGRPMLHHLAAGHQTLVNGASAEWASLGESDEVQVGPYVIRYRAVVLNAAPSGASGGPQ